MDENKLWKMAKARVAFKAHFRKFLYVNGLLWFLWIFVNMMSTSENWSFPWPIYPTFIWGIIVAIHYYNTFRKNAIDPIRHEYEKLKKSKNDEINKK